MKGKSSVLAISFLGALSFCATANARTDFLQDPPKSSAPAPTAQQSGAAGQAPQPGERRMGLFGKVTAIHDQSVEVSTPNGDAVTVKITADTQFRKEREAAKLADFKVGDMVGVRGEENPDHTWTAQMIGAIPAGGFRGGAGGGRGEGREKGAPGGGRGPFMQGGVLGQDFVFGEVKAIDAPRLTVLRPDNVTQTVELTEETSLHKGRDSVTMADIQVGDHVFVRGGMKSNAFEPKSVQVIGPEQWQRMQQMGMAGPPPSNPPKQQDPQKPQEPHH